MLSPIRCVIGVSAALATALLCAAPFGAKASVIVSAGDPTGGATGAVDVLDPPVDEVLSDADGSTGTTLRVTGSAADSFSTSLSVAGGGVTSSANGSYDATLQIDGIHGPSGNPIVSGGSLAFTADSSILLSTGVATDAGEYAWTRADAQVLSALDFSILGVDTTLSVSGSLLDETLSLENVLFTLADTTSGFVILLQDADVAGDDTATPFAHELLLQAGHDYRMVLSTRVRHVCATTAAPNIANCGLPGGLALLFGPSNSTVTQSAAGSLNFSFTPVPEPGSLGLVVAGLAVLAVRRRRA